MAANTFKNRLKKYGLLEPLCSIIDEEVTFSRSGQYMPIGLIEGAGNDNTAVLQAAINYAATNGVMLNLPEGFYEFTDLYLYYDATLNPGYPNNAVSDQGRLRMQGQGRIFNTDTVYGTYKGTVLNCTSSTGGIHSDVPIGGSIYRTEGYAFKELSIIGNSSGTLVDLKSCNNIEFKNVFVLNKSLTGGGVFLGDVYIMEFSFFEVEGGTAGYSRNPIKFSSGVGLTIDGGGGFASGNFTVSGYDIGTKITGDFKQARFGHYEPHHCNHGLVIDGGSIGVGLGFDVFWAEGCTYTGVKCVNNAPLPSFGTAVIEAPVADWTAGRPILQVGLCVTNGTSMYLYTAIGTTGVSAPTGTTVGASIADGTATCAYVGTLDTSQRRACINVENSATSNFMNKSILGDIWCYVESGTIGMYYNYALNNQEVEIDSLLLTAYQGNYTGHGVRTGVYLHPETSARQRLTINSVKYNSFDTATGDVKVSSFINFVRFKEVDKLPGNSISGIASASTINGGGKLLVRVLDAATTITNLEWAPPGAEIILLMAVDGIKITNSSTLSLSKGLNYISKAGDMIAFRNVYTGLSYTLVSWQEAYRSTSSGFMSTAIETLTASTYTVPLTTGAVVVNCSGTCTLTLPNAVDYKGRIINIRTITANTVISASSNVSIDGSVGTAILAGTAGKWAELQSDGTNWVVVTNN